MELEQYFDQAHIKKNAFKAIDNTIGKACTYSFTNVSTTNKTRIALIGLTETRNSGIEKYRCQPDNIRYELYRLASISKIEILDFGNLRIGKKIGDSYKALEETVRHCMQNNIISVIMGGSHDTALSSIKSVAKETNVVHIDGWIDSMHENDFHSESHLFESIAINKGQFSLLGFQTYLCDASQIQKLSDSGAYLMRLGAVRAEMEETEPILRDAELVFFDLNAVRFSDHPASVKISPNGLYAEEACQLAFYAGIGDRSKVFQICEYNSGKDKLLVSAKLSAQIVWHFLQGLANRYNDYPCKELNYYKKVIVKLDRLEVDLVFYTNTTNNRYWLQPLSGEGNLISCSVRDYQMIANGDLPDRLLKYIV